MSPVTQDGSTAMYEAKNKTKIFSRWDTGENLWSMLRLLTKSEGGNKENELVARHDCSSSRRTRLTRTNAKPGARIHEARARATLNNAGRVSGGCVCTEDADSREDGGRTQTELKPVQFWSGRAGNCSLICSPPLSGFLSGQTKASSSKWVCKNFQHGLIWHIKGTKSPGEA